jgi:hypothetical protein
MPGRASCTRSGYRGAYLLFINSFKLSELGAGRTTSISIRAAHRGRSDTDGRWPMGTAMRTGHHRLPNGSVLRVDLEMGRWVGTLYAPSMTIKTQIVGSDAEVHAWAAGLAA